MGLFEMTHAMRLQGGVDAGLSDRARLAALPLMSGGTGAAVGAADSARAAETGRAAGTALTSRTA